MAGIVAPNVTTFMQSGQTRNGEYPGTPFTDFVERLPGQTDDYNAFKGCNQAGSCAPGVGINTGDYDPELRNWDGPPSRETRVNQASSQIGAGDVARTGRDAWPPPSDLPAAGEVITAALSLTDRNDTLSFIQANAQVAPGANATDGTNTVVNRTGKTVPANSWLWGTVTTA